MNNKDDIRIERALKSCYKRLTDISFAAKQYWSYPEEYYDIWRDELTITENYIDKNLVFVVIYEEEIVGFSSVVEVENPFGSGEVFIEKGCWLDHLYID